MQFSITFGGIRKSRRFTSRRFDGCDRDNWIGLFYSIQPRGIIVHVLVHLSRSPETIRDRIRRLLGYSRIEN